MASPLTVLVTGVGGRSVGHQILKAHQMLGQRYRIVDTDASSYSYGLYEVASRYVVPPASSPRYFDSIQRLLKQEKIDVILPGTQPEVRFFAAGTTNSSLEVPVIVNPRPVVELCENKARLYAWLHEQGFDT